MIIDFQDEVKMIYINLWFNCEFICIFCTKRACFKIYSQQPCCKTNRAAAKRSKTRWSKI